VAALTEFQPELVITDFRMPAFDGLTALKLSLQHAPDTPVIILTSAINEDTAVECMKAGAADYVIKEHIKRLGSAVVRSLEEKQERLRRRAAEAALHESDERLRQLADNIDSPLFVLDLAPSGPRVSYLSPAYERIWGSNRENLYRDPFFWMNNVHADDRPAVERALRRILDEGDPLAEVRYRAVRADGPNRYIRVKAKAILSAEGRATRVVGFAEDVTAQTEAEEANARLQARLALAQKMETVGRLAGGVAHDFNNLLTVINGYSKLLLGRLEAGDPLRESLEEIHKAGERAASLTRQLLAFSRKQVLQPRTLDLNRLVAEMRPMLERMVGEDVEVCVESPPGAAMIRADPHQLEQVMMNLAANSRDAMAGGGRLTIETGVVKWDESQAGMHPGARAGLYVMLVVSDTGVGMEEETRRHLFEPFFTTKEVGKGTGLGLSMIQGIVAQSGGFIDVYSEPGGGTAFRIYLPALAEGAADAGTPAPVPVLGGKETVMVVEDQAEIRAYAAKVLREYGYRTIEAKDADDALKQCESGPDPIHLVLTDVVMPNVSGRELVSRLEKMRPGIKALFMSGYTDDFILHHGMLDEGVHFIGKPFTPEELAGTVRAVLGAPRAARVLVADDEAGVRSFLRMALEEGGYQVMEAADGEQALRQARTGHVDLVITDLVMPEREGIETIRALRRDLPGVGIIAISGAFGGQFLAVAQVMGADAVLAKPVSAESLLAKVAEVLKLRR
jgi:PAS domain S-box-containing protein